MSRKKKGKIADFLITAGTVTFFAGLLIGPSPDDAIDKWVMVAGMAMLMTALAFCRKPKVRSKAHQTTRRRSVKCYYKN